MLSPILSRSATATALISLLAGACFGDSYGRDERDALLVKIETLFQEYAAKVSDVPTLGAALLLAKNAPDTIFIDVREARERAVSSIPGALSLAQFEALKERAKHPVVVYCTVGYRSGLSARALRAQGIDARNLRGGILAWIASGGALVDAQGKPTLHVHVYAEHWAVVPKTFIAQF
jgi:rhodanese-related sulfurtransferase